MMLKTTLLAFACMLPLRAVQAPAKEVSPFSAALDGARRALDNQELAKAREFVMRALERDAKSIDAWELRARWAEAANDRDELVYALHTELRLMIAQKAPKAAIGALRERLKTLDANAAELFGMNAKFIATLEELAQQYEKEARPHSAIAVHKLILAIDPERVASQEAIDRIASLPDPSLAGDAKPKDLLADVSDEWIRQFDAEHATWEARAKLERENYTTYTNAGYEVLVRAAEAMEQMNRFYRVFFEYGTEEDGKSVPRIDLNIFARRDEYLKLGKGPPVEWSGGHFTGDAVETYVEGNGFEGMTSTLFHEAAHQFVSLATRAAGWLNEGLASFFEGCRILPNGTVLMNLPAPQRLFPLAERMEKGWMSSATDGIDPSDPSKSEPQKSPTFRIVVENDYQWGPPWYAPTWGVVFFCYNYQDPVDGRFVYRKAFREYINASGGLTGKTAVGKFEEVVLGAPLPPIKGFDREKAPDVPQPKTIDELDDVWKSWMIELRDEQIGRIQRQRPYLRWARAALIARDDGAAQEHFEKGLVADPSDVELLREFAQFLADHKNTDRAAKLALAALQTLETRKPVDQKALDQLDRLLAKWDPKRATIERTQRELASAAQAIVAKYDAAQLPMMVMDLSWRLGRDLGIGELFAMYEKALRASNRSLALWELAYNEKNLEGWDNGGNTSFQAAGLFLDAAFQSYSERDFDYQVLALQRVTAGDYSLEVDVQAERGQSNFSGVIFGRKDAQNFQALLFFPGAPRAADSKAADNSWVDLTSFYGGGTFKTWRHNPVAGAPAESEQRSATARWHKLRIDVAGSKVDCWFDGELLATQEFGTRDVLLGSMGLVQGRGKARFKDVRFVTRDPRDPAGAIERTVRMDRLAQKGAGAVGGSFVGLVPPFPNVARWVQAPRSSWNEKGLVPQLFVLWSIAQNDLVPLEKWLTALHAKYGPLGLEIVSVCSPNDEREIERYLAEHRFPGALGVDRRAGTGIGEVFTTFFVHKFNLPRLLLLDIDGKVVWEGDPGFKMNEPWNGGDSFLDAPLAELVARRKLERLKAWLEQWNANGARDFAAGELEKVWPRLREARELDGSLVPLVHDVQRKLDAIEAAFTDLTKVGAELEKTQRAAALRQLVEWSRLAGVELDKRQLAQLKPFLDNAQSSNWERALKMVEAYTPRIAKSPALALELADKLAALKSVFAVELSAEVRQAGDAPEALARILAAAPRLPARWLASSYFHW
ncbi:MAG: hypothetical protein IT454_04510 [Planctomycetes bacterium]|nr:hypothetical protein [Planctomycetota bacterium]